MNLATGEWTRCSRRLAFEDATVAGLRDVYENYCNFTGVPLFDAEVDLHLDGPVDAPPGLSTQQPLDACLFEKEIETLASGRVAHSQLAIGA